MSNYCKTCQHYRVTNDGPHCFKGKIKAVSPISTGDCWEPVTEKPEIATKVCSKCGRELPVSEFGRHAKTKDGYQPVCRECRSAEMKGRPQVAKKEEKAQEQVQEDKHYLPFGRRPKHPTYVDEETGETMKWCNTCKQYKPITDFHLNKSNKDGHTFECKACHNARTVRCQRKRIEAKKAAEQETKATPITSLEQFETSEIIKELRRRGFHGTLTMEV